MMEGAAGVYEAFTQFDEDGSGYLDIDELHNALNKTIKISKEEVDELFKKLDVNGDQQVTLPEFLDFVRAGAFFVHFMSPMGYFHIKVNQDIKWSDFKKVTQKCLVSTR